MLKENVKQLLEQGLEEDSSLFLIDFTMGADNTQPNEYPTHQVTVEAFYLGKSPVTVADFRTFVEETGYKTDAEKFSNSGVFDVQTGTWNLIDGANWRYPFGENEEKAKDNHPVTQVSWDDARAYCKWAGVRLPTEAEWEYAAKDTENKFSWGNKLVTNAGFKANVWQGKFPDSMRVEDGYQYTSPVGAFGATKAGLTDMGGNVWEWTSSMYDLYQDNPYSFQPDEKKKVIRGGSFLCDSTVCFGYRVSARNFNSRESATVNMGFRTALNAH
jgi:sulfatase modifying factor 1